MAGLKSTHALAMGFAALNPSYRFHSWPRLPRNDFEIL
jgi:hypothetical protein